MINRFRLWVNRNDSKIIMVIIFVIVGYILMKGSNDYYENKNVTSSDNTDAVQEAESEYLGKSLSENFDYESDIYYTDGASVMPKLDESSQKYEYVSQVMEKIVEYMKEVDEENYIFDYIYYIKEYSIVSIYNYSEENNVARYGVLLKYIEDDSDVEYAGYAIINMDYNNNTFSFDGILDDMDYIEGEDIIEIENKGINTF